jgi:hypothetical protein
MGAELEQVAAVCAERVRGSVPVRQVGEEVADVPDERMPGPSWPVTTGSTAPILQVVV